MNGSYYQNPTFPSTTNYESNIEPVNNNTTVESLPMEQSYIENILRLNKGRKVKAYVSFPDSKEWNDKIFEGLIEEAGRDHLIISDPKTGMWSLILMIYLNFVEFYEPIKYSHNYSEQTFTNKYPNI